MVAKLRQELIHYWRASPKSQNQSVS